MSIKKAIKTGECVDPKEWLYRYEDVSTADECGFPEGKPKAAVKLRKLLIHSKTPKGVWVYPYSSYFYGKLRFVLLSGRKRFAYPDKASALTSFIARKKHQLWHLEYQTDQVKAALIIAERWDERGV